MYQVLAVFNNVPFKIVAFGKTLFYNIDFIRSYCCPILVSVFSGLAVTSGMVVSPGLEATSGEGGATILSGLEFERSRYLSRIINPGTAKAVLLYL